MIDLDKNTNSNAYISVDISTQLPDSFDSSSEKILNNNNALLAFYKPPTLNNSECE